MWNVRQTNANMLRFEQLMYHKGHLERLAQTKTGIDDNGPKTPEFLLRALGSKGMKANKELTRKYINRVIFNRMYEIQNKFSPYSACRNVPAKCPAYEKLSENRIRKWDEIYTENNKLYKRFTFARPTYNKQKLNEEYNYHKYLENNIKQNKNTTNPNIEFIPYKRFDRKLKNKIFRDTKKGKNYFRSKSNANINCCEDFKINCKNYYTELCGDDNSFQKNNYNNTFNEFNNDKNEEWFKDSMMANEDGGRSIKRKFKRPHSSKPNIIITREIGNYSGIYSNYINSTMYNKNKSKPNSGKTRTNGSASTNYPTSVNLPSSL